MFVSVWLAWWEEHRGRGCVAGDFPSVTHTGPDIKQKDSILQSAQLDTCNLIKNLLPSIITLHMMDLWPKATFAKMCVVHGRHSHVCVSDAAIKNNFFVHKNLQTLIERGIPVCSHNTDLYTPVKRQTLLQMYRALHVTCDTTSNKS